MRDLQDSRKEIDIIDEQIIRLFEKRMDICKDVAAYKLHTGKPVLDRKRELDKLKTLKAQASNKFYGHGVEELFEQIMSMSRKMQYKLLTEEGVNSDIGFDIVDDLPKEDVTVAYQGIPGAYSQQAATEYFGDKSSYVNVSTFREAMKYVRDGKADYAVLPFENSSAGIVSEIYDLLVEFENYIVGEQIIPINHCLLGCAGTKISDIKTVYSHAQSLMQSAHYLQEKGWQQISMKNNAFAAQKVAEDKNPTEAAIASEYAAKVYGLEILEKGVNDLKENSTRFIIITNQKVFSKDASKISLCFEVNHESGALYHALSHLIYNGLNMTKIESRPLEGRNWEYRFFVDFEGNMEDSAVKNALRGLREETRNMKILGNY